MSFEPHGRGPMAVGGHSLAGRAAELNHPDRELQLRGRIHRARAVVAAVDAHRRHDVRCPAADDKMGGALAVFKRRCGEASRTQRGRSAAKVACVGPRAGPCCLI